MTRSFVGRAFFAADLRLTAAFLCFILLSITRQDILARPTGKPMDVWLRSDGDLVDFFASVVMR